MPIYIPYIYYRKAPFLTLFSIIGRNSLILKEKIATKIQVILALSKILDKVKSFGIVLPAKNAAEKFFTNIVYVYFGIITQNRNKSQNRTQSVHVHGYRNIA